MFPKVQSNGFLLPLFHNDRLRFIEPKNALPKLVEDWGKPDAYTGFLMSRELGDGWTSKIGPRINVNRGRRARVVISFLAFRRRVTETRYDRGILKLTGRSQEEATVRTER